MTDLEQRQAVRIDELEEEVRQLQGALKSGLTLPERWGLTPKEQDLVQALIAGGGRYVSGQRIRTAVYGQQYRSDHIIKVMVYKIRRKGVEIETRPQFGYRLSENAAAALSADRSVQ